MCPKGIKEKSEILETRRVLEFWSSTLETPLLFVSGVLPKRLNLFDFENWNYLTSFQGKGAKANNEENYRGITLFPTLCKIYEIILLNRLKNYASHDQSVFF